MFFVGAFIERPRANEVRPYESVDCGDVGRGLRANEVRPYGFVRYGNVDRRWRAIRQTRASAVNLPLRGGALWGCWVVEGLSSSVVHSDDTFSAGEG